MKVIIFAILAGCVAGMTFVLNKMAMRHTEPIPGAVIYLSFTWLFALILLFGSKKHSILLAVNPKAFCALAVNGLISGVFIYLMLSAYKYGQVSIVAPIQGPTGLIVGVLTSMLILGEQLNLQKGIGILAILGGVILLALAQD